MTFHPGKSKKIDESDKEPSLNLNSPLLPAGTSQPLETAECPQSRIVVAADFSYSNSEAADSFRREWSWK